MENEPNRRGFAGMDAAKREEITGLVLRGPEERVRELHGLLREAEEQGNAERATALQKSIEAFGPIIAARRARDWRQAHSSGTLPPDEHL